MAVSCTTGNHRPRVSVVIPMRNEKSSIERCLTAVLAQDYPPELMEVWVADGQSTDGSREIVERLAREDGRVRVLDNPERIVPTGLNRCIRAATGEVIVRVDGHTEIASDYVRQGVACLQRTGAHVVGGAMRCGGGGLVGDAIAAATSSRFGIGNSYFHYGVEEREVDSVYMGVFTRSVFDAVGLFDEELVCNQDDEYTYRVRRAGGTVLMSPHMKSTYQNRTSLAALVRQYWRYGFYKARVSQKHPRVMSWRHAIPPLFVLALASSAALSPMGGMWGAALPLLAGVYGTTTVAAAGFAARQPGGRVALVLPLVFALIHLSWGAGLLAGLWRFRQRWQDREWTSSLRGVFAADESRGTGD